MIILTITPITTIINTITPTIKVLANVVKTDPTVLMAVVAIDVTSIPSAFVV